MALKTCTVHNITYNDKLDPTCPQCSIAGHAPAEQVDAVAGEFGAPKEE